MEQIHEESTSLRKLCKVESSSRNAVIFYDGKNRKSLSCDKFLSVRTKFIGKIKNIIPNMDVNNVYVGIFAEPSIYLPVLIHALIELCWTFVPLSLKNSPSSLLHYIKRCHMKFIIVDRNNLSAVLSQIDKQLILKVFEMEEDFHFVQITDSIAAKIQVRQYKIAYVVQSSGSTGKPKAIFVTEPCIIPNIADMRDKFAVKHEDVLFISSALTFDASILLMLVAWSSGATMALVSMEVYSKPHLLALSFESLDISILQCTPSFLHFVGFKRLEKYLFKMKSRLKVLALGGERFPSKDIIKDLFLIMPEIQIFNIYGTSELSSWASIYQVQKDLIVTTTFKGSDWVPIGEALSQTVIEVRDDFGGLVSNGVGQVWSGSHERICFVDDEDEVMTMRFTGDVGRIKDNEIYLCGRSDNRLKHNGRMVDLDLLCMVVEKDFGPCCSFIDHSGGQDQLTLYIQSSFLSENVIEMEADVIKLIKKIFSSAYIPRNIVFVERIPITPHGKVDKNALKDAPVPIDLLSNFLTDESLRILWNASLGLDTDRIVLDNDNFIECGGDSFTAVYFISSIQKYTESFNIFTGTFMEEYLELLFKETFKTLLDYWNKVVSGEKCARDKKGSFVNTKEFKTLSNEKCKHFLSYQKQSRVVKCHCINRTTYPLAGFHSILQVVLTSWKFNVGKCIDASPLIVFNDEYPDGVVIIGSHSKLMVCLDLQKGHLIWKSDLGDRIESSAIVCPGGDVIAVGCYDGYLYFLKLHSGEIVWKYFTGDSIKSTAVADMKHGLVVIGSHGKKIHALDVHSTRFVWIYTCQSSCSSTPIIDEEAECVYVALLSGRVLCLCVKTGRVLWEVSLKKPIFSSLCLARGILFVGCVDSFLYALDLRGTIIWEFETKGPVFSSPVYAQGMILLGSSDCFLYCLNMDGQLLWKYETSSAIVSAVGALFPKETHLTTQTNVDYNLELTRLKKEENIFDINQRKRKYETISIGRRNKSKPCLYFIAVSTKGQINILSDEGVRISHLQLPGEVYSSPVVINDQILIGCRDDNIYSLMFGKSP